MKVRQLYNKYLKISGTNVTIKNYLTHTNMKGYSVKIKNTSFKEKKGVTQDYFILKNAKKNIIVNVNRNSPIILNGVSRETFDKSALRATNKIYDIVDCNAGKHLDYLGKKTTIKFLTLTFKEDVTDVKIANKEFTKFNKRLSYSLYKTNKNVLKYLSVIEFQSDIDFQGNKKANGGSIHYHVIYFNLPYVAFIDLMSIWNNGGTYIESIKNNDKDKLGNPIENIAKYIAKYVNKTNSYDEDNFLLWSSKGMLNQKRFFTSRGLKKPTELFALVNEDEMSSIYELLDDKNTKNFTYENEYRGVVVISKFKLDKNTSTNLYDAFKQLDNSNNTASGFYTTFKQEYGKLRKKHISKINHQLYNGTLHKKEFYKDKLIKEKLGNKSKHYFNDDNLSI